MYISRENTAIYSKTTVIMKYFFLADFYEDENAKKLGIDNRPSERFIENIFELVHDLMEPLRGAWGKYCKVNKLGCADWNVTAGYRCDDLIRFYEDKKSSPHWKGLAADFELANNEYAIFHKFAGPWLRNNNIRFDEIIWNIDDRYIHLAIKNNEGKQRAHIKKE